VAILLSVFTVVSGLIVVAVRTSLPELAASTVSVFRKEGDIGVGNGLLFVVCAGVSIYQAFH